MATEAQVNANRSNAQKSTGPRTPEGKAAVAQNAVQHGLLAQEVVVKGEDPGEFAFYRDGMLAELAPAGQMESLLAERIVGLAWRLRRAERLQAAAFDALPEPPKPKPFWSDEAGGWVRPQRPELDPGGESRAVVQDFAETRILDRLLVYERRIEHSLYRTMAELRNLRHWRETDPPKAGAMVEAGSVSSTGIPCAGLRAGLPGNPDQGRDGDPKHDLSRLGTHAHATGTAGVSTNVPEAQEPACETKPICEGIGIQGGAPVAMNRAWEPGSGVSNLTPDARPLPPEPSCETKPISAGADRGQVGYRPIFRRRR